LKKILRPYQRDGFYYTGQVEHPALFWGMRLGKTLVVIRRVLADFKGTVNCLIVAPYSALYGWQEHLLAESIPPDEICLLDGPRAIRIEKHDLFKPWCLINKEGFLTLPEIAGRQWDVVVCDESTFLKNPKAKVSKFFTRNFRNVSKRFILTGTPCPESPLDLFQQLRFLDPTILQSKNYWDFRHTWFEQANDFDYVLKPEGKEFLKLRLQRFCSVLSRNDVGINVCKAYERRVFTLPKSIRKIYDTVEREFLLEVKGKIVDSTIFAMKKFIWLRRLCGGEIDGKVLHTEKLKIITDLLSGELRNERIVIWAVFLDEIHAICTALYYLRIKHESIDGDVPPRYREDFRKDFKAGNLQVLVCQPEIFKHGTDLSCCDTEIYYSSPLGLETRQQSEDRLINIKGEGKLNPLIIDLIAQDSIEEDIYDSLLKKETRQEMVKRMMKRLA
jgi:SNF2 family DNA or RNA helicase